MKAGQNTFKIENRSSYHFSGPTGPLEKVWGGPRNGYSLSLEALWASGDQRERRRFMACGAGEPSSEQYMRRIRA